MVAVHSRSKQQWVPDCATPRAAVSLPFSSDSVVAAVMVERGAQALFEVVFAASERLDGKHLWLNCEENTKEGFRREATAVIRAAWPFLSL